MQTQFEILMEKAVKFQSNGIKLSIHNQFPFNFVTSGSSSLLLALAQSSCPRKVRQLMTDNLITGLNICLVNCWLMILKFEIK